MTDDGASPIETGHVIFLDGSITELRDRISFKHRYWNEKALEDLVANIKDIYNDVDKSTISTQGKGIQDVIREIAQIIFRDDYRPANVGAKLEAIGRA